MHKMMAREIDIAVTDVGPYNPSALVSHARKRRAIAIVKHDRIAARRRHRDRAFVSFMGATPTIHAPAASRTSDNKNKTIASESNSLRK